MPKIKKEVLKPQKVKCPGCGSSQAYVRIKTKEIVCSDCGTVTPQKVKAAA